LGKMQADEDLRCVRRYLFDMNRVVDAENNNKVVFGWEMETNAEIAAKIIDLLEDGVQEACNNELAVMQKVQGHKNIVRLLDSFQYESNFYFIMELIPCDLHGYLDANFPLKNSTNRRTFKQMVGAVSHLHRLFVVHRDLKLQNVLYNPSTERVVLIDFGWSKSLRSRSDRLCPTAPTPCYAAPELYLQDSIDPYAADVYSLGVILYALVFHTFPFPDENGTTYYRNCDERNQFPREDLIFPSKVSRQLKSLLISLLAFQPINRPTVCEINDQRWLSKSTQSNCCFG